MHDGIALWKWIGQAKSAGISTTSLSSDIEALIASMPKQDLVALHRAYTAAYSESDLLLVWEACSLFLGSTASDDSFEYFRNWLIWGGERLFANALRDIDSLVELCEAHRIDIANPFFEALSVLGDYAYVGRTDEQHRQSDVVSARSWSWLDSSANKIQADLPKLWYRYGTGFRWDPPAVPEASSFEAPGLGLMHVGDRVRHKFGYGEGVVTEVLIADTALATIAFADAARPFRITSDHFERV